MLPGGSPAISAILLALPDRAGQESSPGMSYSIQSEGQFLRIAFRGHVTRHDIEAALRELSEFELGLQIIPDRVIDLQGVEGSEISAADVIWAAGQRRSKRFPNPFRSAVIAPRPAQFGYARMFQVLNGHPDITLRAFRDEGDALAWLQTGPTPV